MRKLTMTLTAAALMLGTMAMTASAQTQQPGAASFHAQIQSATPIQKAACRGPGPIARRAMSEPAPRCADAGAGPATERR
jgi:hypothetical protein